MTTAVALSVKEILVEEHYFDHSVDNMLLSREKI